MKSLEELQVTAEEISGALFVQALAGEIVKDAVAMAVARNGVTINRDMVGSAGRSISFPRRTGVTFAVITENASGTLVTPSYTTVDVTPVKRGAIVQITNEALEASRFDVIEEVLDSLARAAAQTEDVDIYDAILSRVTDTATLTPDSATTAYTLSNVNILAVQSVAMSGTTLVVVTDYFIDQKDGIVRITTPGTGTTEALVDYEYAATITMVESDTAGILGFVDILQAQAEVRANNYMPNAVFLHPNQYADLLNEAKFYDISQYGADDVQARGAIAKMAGMRVYVSTNVPDGVSIVLDSTASAKLVYKRDITVKWDEDITLDNRLVAVTSMYDTAVINDGAICLVGGSSADNSRA